MSRFVIKTVQSGVPGLSEQLPAAGYTIDMWTDSRGATAFHAVLETPLRFHLGPGIDTDRLDANRFDRDSAGPFVWVTEVIMAPHHADQQPHPGMTDFAMDVAAVLPPSDADTASPEVSTIGLGVVDDAPEPSGPARTEEVDEGGLPSTANLDPPLIDIASAHQDPRPLPIPAGAAHRGPVTDASAPQRVTELRGQIATIVGWATTEVPEPKCVKAGKEDRQGGPAYSFHRGYYRYFTNDMRDGFVMRETTDLDELLYWIADDITRSAAWEWTKRAPTFGTVSNAESRRVIAVPMWHTLMYALRYSWGRRTQQSAEQRMGLAGGR